jgi:hypothetical protein
LWRASLFDSSRSWSVSDGRHGRKGSAAAHSSPLETLLVQSAEAKCGFVG